MDREHSILTQTWMTNDGRCLSPSEFTDDHLRALQIFLQGEMTPGLDEDTCCAALDAWMVTPHKSTEDDMDLDLYRAGWIRIVRREIASRAHLRHEGFVNGYVASRKPLTQHATLLVLEEAERDWIAHIPLQNVTPE